MKLDEYKKSLTEIQKHTQGLEAGKHTVKLLEDIRNLLTLSSGDTNDKKQLYLLDLIREVLVKIHNQNIEQKPDEKPTEWVATFERDIEGRIDGNEGITFKAK